MLDTESKSNPIYNILLISFNNLPKDPIIISFGDRLYIGYSLRFTNMKPITLKQTTIKTQMHITKY